MLSDLLRETVSKKCITVQYNYFVIKGNKKLNFLQNGKFSICDKTCTANQHLLAGINWSRDCDCTLVRTKTTHLN
jgi:hypothetical protein